MAQYTSLSELIKALNQNITVALDKNVATVVKDTESKKAEDVLIENPVMYERRINGGISDTTNMISSVADNVLKVVNETTFNEVQSNSDYKTANSGIGLAGLIEYGNGWNGNYYDYPRSDIIIPRNFTEQTKEELIATNAHVEALRQGLIEQGLTVV